MKFKVYFEKAIAQAIPILVTALLSAGISMLQVLLTTYIGAHQISTDPAQVATLGASLKAIHTASSYYKVTV